MSDQPELIDERRTATRLNDEREARLLFVASPPQSEEGAAEGKEYEPLIGYTRNISETGLLLFVPGMRRSYLDFYGADCRLRITLSLPVGTVSLEATPKRYEWLAEDDLWRGYFIGVEVSDMSDVDRARLFDYLKTLN